MMNPQPVILIGSHAKLEPLESRHAEGLYEVGRDAAVWRHLIFPGFTNVTDARDFVETALRGMAEGSEVPFAIVSLSDKRVAGTTRYLSIRRADRVLEIGWTWLGLAYQRTAINTECKYLLLRHAFESLGAVRVQLKTDARNEVSQRAIERIGGVREGVLRKFQLTQGGRHRDTVMYSLIDEEWPAAKARLESLMGRQAD